MEALQTEGYVYQFYILYGLIQPFLCKELVSWQYHRAAMDDGHLYSRVQDEKQERR